MMPDIVDANRLTVDQAVSPMPTVRSTLLGWFKPLGLVKITLKIDGVRTIEVPTELDARGTWQPFGAEQLKIKPEGQRSWRWFMVHTTPDVVLLTADVIQRVGINYRVMEKLDYADEGYVEYHVVNDADMRGGGS